MATFFTDYTMIRDLVSEFKLAKNRAANALADADRRGIKKPTRDTEYNKQYAIQFVYLDTIGKWIMEQRCRYLPGEMVDYDYGLGLAFIEAVDKLDGADFDNVVKEFTEPTITEEVIPEMVIPAQTRKIVAFGKKEDSR